MEDHLESEASPKQETVSIFNPNLVIVAVLASLVTLAVSQYQCYKFGISKRGHNTVFVSAHKP